MRFAWLALVFTALVPIFAAAPALVEPVPTLSELQPGDVQSDGVWKVFFRPRSGNETIARLAEVDFATNRLVVRVNGKVYRLAQESATWMPKRKTGCVVGDTCTEKWSGHKVCVELTYKVVEAGAECQQFRGAIKVTTGRDSQSFAIEGETGS